MGVSGDELVRAFEATCRALGLELDDVELRGTSLQVTVDRPGGALDLDLLAETSRALSAYLDEHDELAPAGRYELEVSSPGLERRLRRPAQFLRATGTRVSARTMPGTEGERRVEGTLVSADEDGFVLELADGPRRIAYRDLERARTVFDWEADLAARRAVEQAEKAAAGGKAQRSRRAGREQTAPDDRRGDERERVAR
ncbi:MAG: ribosome maturation factor RimP [Actinomycetota bacterium]|nr:ribosome maturation factor RimP [Actinomycetota bacterium]